MGACQSGDCRPSRVLNNLVDVDEIIQCRGSISIAGRYCTSRAFESEFVVGRVLGVGVSGPVRLATGRADGKTYAVKSFTKGDLQGPGLMHLKHEAEIYLCLDHPHVTQLKMVYESDDMVHFVMEHMRGGELYDRLHKNGSYPEAEAADAARQMVLALSYLHSHNIVHRDLKPENFLYQSRQSSHLKLIDFGLAKFWDRSCKMSWRCGSLPYMAPEVLSGSYTDKADLWSLGVIVYMLLVGTPPFPDGSHAASPQAAFHCREFCRLSLPARGFVEALLDFDPVRRPSAKSALRHLWMCSSDKSAMEPPIGMQLLNNLRAFTRAPLFQRAVLSMMAWSLPADSDVVCRQQFLLMDIDRTGTISQTVFKNILVGCLSVEIAEAELLFGSSDINGSDEIDYSEFLAVALSACRHSVPEDVTRTTFRKFDHDGNGLISADDLHFVLGGCFSGARVEDLIKEADTSGDGHIDYPEFLAYFRRGAAETTGPLGGDVPYL